MDNNKILEGIVWITGPAGAVFTERYDDEVIIEIEPKDYAQVCKHLHKALRSPVMSMFASDERVSRKEFVLYCVFADYDTGKWYVVITAAGGTAATPSFASISKDIYSALLFERELKEQFGIIPEGCPDTRRLNLHDEVWPEGFYPLRKDFKKPDAGTVKDYVFDKIEGEGLFEVPVGPVHAGVIGPGHFRFSVAGEPIINLEIRLGFTHRGVEKLFEGKDIRQALPLSECVCGDSAFAHSLAFCLAAEKIAGVKIPPRAEYLRAVFLELERMYNHVSDVGGIAVDVGFSFPNALASMIKERLLRLNERISGSRYLKGLNIPGGVAKDMDKFVLAFVKDELAAVGRDFGDLKKMLFANGTFMDRIEGTGILKKRVAEDLGVTGLAARASGIVNDLRKIRPIYQKACFQAVKEDSGDVCARLNVRIREFEESRRLIEKFVSDIPAGPVRAEFDINGIEGSALGCVEAWRGPVLYWVSLDKNGIITRCKVTDPSVKNWQGLAFAAPGNIVPDFPLCNKSFDLSYSGNDL